MRMAKRTLSDEAREYFRQHGARGGKLGGAKSWAHLTAAQRRARALKASRAAAAARTKKAKENK